MLTFFNYFKIILLLYWVDSTVAMVVMNRSVNILSSGSNSDLMQFLTSKAYVPNEMYLPKTSVMKSADPDANYILSKLSDEELIRLLNKQPKKNEYDISDAIKLASISNIAFDTSNVKQNKIPSFPKDGFENQKNTIKNRPDTPVFRLDYKPIEPFNFKEDMDPKYVAIQKLNNMLYSRPWEQIFEDDEEKKELLFDILVAQLKSLCCKKSKLKNNVENKKHKFKSILNEIIAQNTQKNLPELSPTTLDVNNEHMFLILNDEIKSSNSEELIVVDPDSLDRNSSVLLLGPITTHLSNSQLKLVMNRISNELSRPEYLPVLQQLSEGTISDNNIRLVKSLITGPETRRYIKPHRCNHQSRLARVYGGPKWIICTGYLNLNSPSLYDK